MKTFLILALSLAPIFAQEYQYPQRPVTGAPPSNEANLPVQKIGCDDLIGISVYDSFEADSTAATGLIPYPDLNAENLLGGHALHAGIAYDDTIQCPNSPNPGAVMFQNSWGPWGTTCPLTNESGFGWLPYDYLLSSDLTSDVRLGHLGRAW